MTDYSEIPVSYMAEGMKLYLEERIPPGSFLLALLSNDLMLACSTADDVNRCYIFEWCLWLHNEAPYGSYGSPEIVRSWLSTRENSE